MFENLQSLRPSLPRHVALQARAYRGEQWYVLEDKSTGRFHRVSEAGYRLLELMNGGRTLGQILKEATTPTAKTCADKAPEQQDVVALLQYLYVSDLLICDLPPNTKEVFTRQKKNRAQKWAGLLTNPVSWKISLGDPSKLLDRLQPLARLLTRPVAAAVWLTVIVAATVQVFIHWPELAASDHGALFTPEGMFLLWLTYPILKLVHEFGHALFTRAWGGSVTECGLLIVMGTPLPYVDASSSTAFASKRRRLMVSAAGMAVELFIAALAFFLWLPMEDGLVRTLLFSLMVLGSVSTLFFNGNPLLKFDGYHLLCDLLEVPNLAARASQQIQYVLRRFIYRIATVGSPAKNWAGAIGLSLYAIGAFTYRMFILGMLVFLALQISLEFGLVLALWLLFFQGVWPLIKHFRTLFHNPNLRAKRLRPMSIAVTGCMILFISLFVVPVPLSTRAEGVVWLPADSQVRAQSAGEVERLLVLNGQSVTVGQPILQLSNISLESELKEKLAILAEFQARFEEVWSSDRTQAGLLQEDIHSTESKIQFLQEKVQKLSVQSPIDGRIELLQDYELVGSYLGQGDLLGYVVSTEPVTVRVAVTQEQIGLIREYTREVKIKLVRDIGRTHKGELANEVPGGTFTLPSPALSTIGGGRVNMSTEPGKELQTESRIFVVDVRLPEYRESRVYGDRAYVKFTHPPEPLANQLYRHLRQLFISTLLY